MRACGHHNPLQRVPSSTVSKSERAHCCQMPRHTVRAQQLHEHMFMLVTDLDDGALEAILLDVCIQVLSCCPEQPPKSVALRRCQEVQVKGEPSSRHRQRPCLRAGLHALAMVNEAYQQGCTGSTLHTRCCLCGGKACRKRGLYHRP